MKFCLHLLLLTLLLVAVSAQFSLRKRTGSRRKTLFVPTTRARNSVNLSVFYNAQTDEYITTNSITKQPPSAGYYGAAWATFDDTIQTNGWSTLTIQTNGSQPDPIQVYAAGMAEGTITRDLIQSYWFNDYQQTVFSPFYPNKNKTLENLFTHFLMDNLLFMEGEMGKVQPTPELQSFWNQIGLIFTQLEAMHDAYNDATFDTKYKMSLFDFFKFQVSGDASDIISALNPSALNFNKMTKEEAVAYHTFANRCSALVKYSSDRSKLIATHATWDTFSSMLRIYKHYNFPLKSAQSVKVSFSSNPGWLASVDDFYVLDTGLAVIETTNNIFNMDMYKNVQSKSVLYWVRNIVANRLALTGQDWARIFAYYNSGTYNNQWMITDFKVFKPFAVKSDPNLLTILEQAPGMIRTTSASSYLDQQSGYWPSYNVPFFPDVYNATGYMDMYQKHGNDFSYSQCPRANIFRRDQPNAKDTEGVKSLIRQNKWQSDPLSLNNACNQIAARCDLNTDTTKRIKAFGAIDAKVVDSDMIKQMQSVAQSGPTHDDQAPFNWSKWPNDPHSGQPNEFNFDWVMQENKNLI